MTTNAIFNPIHFLHQVAFFLVLIVSITVFLNLNCEKQFFVIKKLLYLKILIT